MSVQLSDLLQLRVPGVSLVRGLRVKPTAEAGDIEGTNGDDGARREVSPRNNKAEGKLLHYAKMLCAGASGIRIVVGVHGGGSGCMRYWTKYVRPLAQY